MRDFDASDFVPLDDFPLLWRWTQRSHDLLPSDVLATIRPLDPAAAAALAPEAAARCAERPLSRWEMTICAEWDQEEAVRARLEALPVAGAERVVVSWDGRTAVLTLWGTFVRYWGAFCYPSSDDVTVWAPGSDWTLCYRHFQVIEFASSSRAV